LDLSPVALHDVDTRGSHDAHIIPQNTNFIYNNFVGNNTVFAPYAVLCGASPKGAAQELPAKRRRYRSLHGIFEDGGLS
jgi:hypothetical protein